MTLPLVASVALATAPTASAATPTKAAFNQSGVRADRDYGERGRHGYGYNRGRHGYDRGRHGYGYGYGYGYDRGRHGYGYGYGYGYDRGRYGLISCFNPRIGWHVHDRWDRLHRWDRCQVNRWWW